MMKKSELVADLKQSLHDAGEVLSDPGDFERLLDVARQAIVFKRPLTKMGDITLVADTGQYSGVPSDLVAPKVSPWGYTHKSRRTPWNQRINGPLPVLSIATDGGSRVFLLTPPPTAEQIALFGASYRYYYYAAHVIDETEANTTVQAADRSLLLLRAQAEAMRELAIRNYTKPVNLRGGEISSGPKNGTPAALYAALLEEFDAAR